VAAAKAALLLPFLISRVSSLALMRLHSCCVVVAVVEATMLPKRTSFKLLLKFMPLVAHVLQEGADRMSPK
jgi:hypothetical protein